MSRCNLTLSSGGAGAHQVIFDFAKTAEAIPECGLDASKACGGPPTAHGLSSNTMALITSDCGATRSLGTKWPWGNGEILTVCTMRILNV